ncbi:BC1872 family protein [Solidesulfovibrio sp. C21]|uniref:BC1872 family protein n=1 Tax=Solidesulfovibrio sp. C21 TaxID=3398613 RepID=UPI0039FD09C1
MSDEMDHRVAKEILGLKIEGADTPRYSADINAALEVVHHYDKQNYIWTMQSETGGRWRVMLTKGPRQWHQVVSDDGLPAAICLAALKTVATAL